MNCKLCQQEMIAYHEGSLPGGTRAQIEIHLSECIQCGEELSIISLAEKTIAKEKANNSNPFLSTRVMAFIDELERKQMDKQTIPVFQRVLKPALITFSIAVAMFIGILSGSLYQTHTLVQSNNEIPSELANLDDASLESVNMFVNE
jgi:anti-sigma factor RsiW